jgi:hypothetical protein
MDWRKLVAKTVELVALLLIALTVAAPIDAWLGNVAANDVLRLILLFAVVFALQQGAVALADLLTGAARPTLKTLAAQFPSELGPTLLIYLCIWYAGPYWWLVAGAAGLLIAEGLLRLYTALVRRHAHPGADLEERVARLAQGTGLRIVPKRVADGWNAWAMGLGGPR